MTLLMIVANTHTQANPSDADISGKKKIQTRITHNDGGSWKPVNPPGKDSLGQEYDCRSTVSSGACSTVIVLTGLGLFLANPWVY
jgi:hypothetical protein